ncbi:MAG: hypothetical protein FWD69_07745 [Polyangiaceae bacterium]|nr:hypothetical protein [Polyangiaceae bacterium]
MKTLSFYGLLVLSGCLTSCAKFTVRDDPDAGVPPGMAGFLAELEIPKLTTVVQGTTTKVPIKIHRLYNYTGSGILHVTGLPDGIQASSVTISESADPSQVDAVDLSLVADMPATGEIYPTPILVVGHTEESTSVLTTGLPLFVRGKPGTLDTTFADGGVYEGNSYGSFKNVVSQSDGTVLVSVGNRGGDTGTILRLNADGSLDTTFAINRIANGRVATTADGHIVMAGTGDLSSPMVSRYTSDGAPDTSFNQTGSVTVPVPNG